MKCPVILLLFLVAFTKGHPLESNPFATKLKATPFRLSDGLFAFNDDLFTALARSQKGNVVFSPFSLHTALSMALIGAPNNTMTYQQLALALHMKLEHAEDYLYNYLKALLFYDSVRDNTKIKLANKAFADQKLAIKANYLTVLELFYR